MITRAEYTQGANRIDQLAGAAEVEVGVAISSETVTVKSAIIATQEAANRYHTAVEANLVEILKLAASTTVDHYNRILELGLTNAQKELIQTHAIHKQFTEPYYGASLEQRQKASRLDMTLRIKRSAQVSRKDETKKLNLTRVFRQPYPFGSANTTDKRILLGQVVKLEHDIALDCAAQHKDTELAKWQLSHKHKLEDICDSYAEHVDPEVAKYLERHKINLSPVGIYFLKDVPQPPHPNCQCYLSFVHRGRLTNSLVERTIDKLKDLLGRLKRKPKN